MWNGELWVWRKWCTCRCVYDRKLHKDEIRRQKERALKTSVDTTDSGSDMEIDSGFSVPGRIWNKLFRCVKLAVVYLKLYTDVYDGSFVGRVAEMPPEH